VSSTTNEDHSTLFSNVRVLLAPSNHNPNKQHLSLRTIMNKILRTLTLVAALLASAMLSQRVMAASNYTDKTGDTFPGVGGGGILDITGVEVSNDPTDVIFKITYAADINSTDWGNYMIGINDPTLAGGSTTNNGWGRPIRMANGMDYWVGTWVNGGNGGQFWTYSAGAWNQTGTAPTVTKSTFTETIRFPFANMGLSTNSGNNTFEFDIYTSGGGGGDGAIDALSTTNQSVANWGDTFITTNVLTYTIQPIDNTPTNKVFFSVNMEVPISFFTNGLVNPPIPPTAFEPGADQLYVVSSAINGGLPGAGSQLIRVGTTDVYTNTLDVIAYTNTTIQYKFKGEAFPGFEVPQLSCGNDRSLLITSDNMSAPAAYWSDSQLTDPTNTVTFQVDMLFPDAVPPGTNVYVRGNFNDWGNSQPPLLLTNVPSTTLWVGTLTLPYFPVGGCKPLQYKFVNGTTYESISDRTVNVTTSNPILAATFNNVEACDIVEETNFVTFTVSMTNAVGTDALVYDGTQGVYLNGSFAGWWGWGNTNDAATNYLMTLNPGTSNYSLTVPFAPASLLRLVYKYSMNGQDNESGFQQDHVRYIRTLPGQTSYSMPLDNWLGTNATYLATRTEPKFGFLTAAPGSPGQMSVQWLGLKCVQLQGSPSLSPASWNNHLGTDGTSSTNVPTSGSENYFRLIDTSP
jgi:hypothetical protein